MGNVGLRRKGRVLKGGEMGAPWAGRVPIPINQGMETPLTVLGICTTICPPMLENNLAFHIQLLKGFTI